MFPSKDTLDRIKLAFELVTKFLIVALIIGAVFFTSFIADIGKTLMVGLNIRIKEIELFGIKLEGVSEDLKDSVASISDLRKVNSTLSTLLSCSVTNSCTQVQKAEVDATLKRSTAAAKAAEETTERLERTIADTEKQIAEITKQVASPSDGTSRWIVITGSDRDIASAEFEAKKLRESYPTTVILKNKGRFRTVAVFPDKAAARAAEGNIERIMKRPPYSRSLTDWCPVMQEDASKRYQNCM